MRSSMASRARSTVLPLVVDGEFEKAMQRLHTAGGANGDRGDGNMRRFDAAA